MKRKTSTRLFQHIQSICVLTLVLLVASCASKKNNKPLVATTHQNVPALKLETTEAKKALEEIDSTLKINTSTSQSPLVDPAAAPPLDDSQRVEQELTDLKATGIHRNYNFSPTIHYDWRKPQFVMIHHTSQNSLAQTIRTFQLGHTQVSSHYVIGRDGQVVQMLNDYMRSWHAGKGKWGHIEDMNSVSIGIELDNNGREPFPEVQINALLGLLDTLKTKYRIPQKNFIGHEDFAPGRKNDPSAYFPWKTLAHNGFGIWYNESFLPPPPSNFNPIDALKIMGYNTANEAVVIRAFKKKYIQTDTTPTLTPRDISVLYDLYRKYY